jgi:hypothetical protein
MVHVKKFRRIPNCFVGLDTVLAAEQTRDLSTILFFAAA